MDLTSRLRAIVRGTPGSSGAPAPVTGRRELTYEPDSGAYEAEKDLDRAADVLGARPARTPFGDCLVVDRRYDGDRVHGDVRVAECVMDFDALSVLEPPLSGAPGPLDRRVVFLDLETTGLSGGAGTVAFLVGCAWFEYGALQVRQFLLTSYAGERALLAAAAECFEGTTLLVTYNGKSFDVPVMETRWLFHRMEMPLDGVPHFDMLHTARRLWRPRTGNPLADEGGCRLTSLERTLIGMRRVGDVPGFEIPGRFFQFLRSGDARPLEPVLEHNRLDLVSLAVVTARALRLGRDGEQACRDAAEALALGRIFERAGALVRAERCYRRAASASDPDVRIEAMYRLGLRCRRDRRFEEAAGIWRELLRLTSAARHLQAARHIRRFAVEALAIHQEHRERDLPAARDWVLSALSEDAAGRQDRMRHRLARLDRKLARRGNPHLFGP